MLLFSWIIPKVQRDMAAASIHAVAPWWREDQLPVGRHRHQWRREPVPEIR
jgi:hypothetical protein